MASYHDKKINDFAIRSFRDVADKDYIAARLAFRADLLPQFMWMAQQAIEKYAKAILCFYRVPAPRLKHDISSAFDLMSKLPIKVELTAGPRKMIDHIRNVWPISIP